MKKNYSLSMLILVFLLLPMMLFCQAPVIKLSCLAGKQNVMPASDFTLLYGQLLSPSTEGYVACQDFPDYPDYSCQAADDFLVPEGEMWTVDEIVIPGYYNTAGSVAPQVHLFIYTTDPVLNAPGTELYSLWDVPFTTSPEGRLTLTPLEPLALESGHYWVCVQPYMSADESGQWFWQKQVSPTIEQEFNWRNPAGGFGIGCIAWTAAHLVPWGNPMDDWNLAFGLYGSRFSGEACCLPDGRCIDTTRVGCLTLGGIPQGIGTTCSADSCIQQPTDFFLMVGNRIPNDTSWYWIGGADEITRVRLFAYDPDIQILNVGFSYSIIGSGEWVLYDFDYDGFDYSTPGPAFGFSPEWDGWSGYLSHSLLPPENVYLKFKANVTTSATTFEILSPDSILYDVTPPSFYSINIDDYFATTNDSITIDIDPVLANIDYIRIILSEIDTGTDGGESSMHFEKGIKPLGGGGPSYGLPCAPSAAAAALKYLEEHGYPDICGGKNPVDLIYDLRGKDYLKTPERSTDNGNLFTGIERWIRDHLTEEELKGFGFKKQTAPKDQADMWKDMLAALLNKDGNQVVICSFIWPDPNNCQQQKGHSMVFNSVVIETPGDTAMTPPGWVRVDFLDSWNNEIVTGNLNIETLEANGFPADGSIPDGAKITQNIIIGTPQAKKKDFETIVYGPDPAPVVLPFNNSTFNNLRIYAYDLDNKVDYQSLVVFHLDSMYDFGDAPDAPYPTLTASSGAYHLLDGITFLGASVDGEGDGQPAINADGDNINGTNDEDGVTFTSALIQGQVATVNVVASKYCMLNAWVDYNHTTGWSSAIEQIFDDQPLVPGLNSLSFVVTATALTGNTYARFRVNSNGGISYDGYGYEGEVEDYLVNILPRMDFGDAPDWPYPTLLINNGARHIYNPDVFLGNLIDTEPDGQPNATATGDDIAFLDDEDGVTFTGFVVVGGTGRVRVRASVAGRLNAWFDFNKNGSWADAGEQIFTNRLLVAGINNLTFPVPAGSSIGSSFARFRFNTTGGLSFNGLAGDGEVEDYKRVILPAAWGFVLTNTTHIIAIPANLTYNCLSFSEEDYVGAFFTDNNGNLKCGGAIIWDGSASQVLVTFGDDPTTLGKEGFSENEAFTWKVFNGQTVTEQGVMVSYDPSLPDNDGKFHSNGTSAISGIMSPLIVSTAAAPEIICAGSTVQLSAVVTGGCGQNTFSWSSVPAGFTSNIQYPVANPLVITTYFVTVQSGFSTVTKSVIVTVKPLPTVICPQSFSLCANDPAYTLTGGTPGGGTYSGTGVLAGKFYPATAGLGVHSITYSYTDPTTGCSNSCTFLITVSSGQILSIPAGWSGISSNIQPTNPDVEAMFSPIISKLVILYNLSGIFMPSIPVNTLGNWNTHKGYVIKVTEDADLAVCGAEDQNKIVNLNQGWNLIPVLSSSPYNIVTLFTGVPGFTVAKDVAGSGVYWKSYGINTIGNVIPGKAYYVRMNTAGSINYALPADNSSTVKPQENSVVSSPWNVVINTPASHLVAFNIQNSTFQTGDIIGGFTQEGLCAGAVEIKDTLVPFAINLNGDDAYSAEKDGFENGEILNYQLFRPSIGKTFNLEVTYNPGMNTGNFENNGLSEVTSVKMSATGISNPESENLKIYPNPAKDLFFIESASKISSVEMMNFTGQMVYSKTSVDSKTIQVNVSEFATGVYFLKIKTDEGIRAVKVTVRN